MHQFRIAVRYLQKEFPVVLDDFFQVLYAGGDSCSQQLAQGCRGMLQPMFESPHIPLNLKAQSERISRIKNARPGSSFFSDRVDKKRQDCQGPLVVLQIHEPRPSREAIRELQAQPKEGRG